MIPLEKAKELLAQLEAKGGLPEEMYGWRFDKPLENFNTLHIDPEYNEQQNEYLVERCRRAESLIIPDAANRVREVMRAAMDAQFYYTDSMNDDQLSRDERNKRMQLSYDFREICEPSSSKEKP